MSEFQKMLDSLFTDLVQTTYLADSIFPYKLTHEEGYSVITIPVPGYKKEEISVDIDNSILKIIGTPNASKYAKPFEKKFSLSNKLNLDEISAKCEDGLLVIKCAHLKSNTKNIIIN